MQRTLAGRAMDRSATRGIRRRVSGVLRLGVVLALGLALARTTTAKPQSRVYCAEGVHAADGELNGYSERFTRCEGLYEQKDSLPPDRTLTLLSLIEAGTSAPVQAEGSPVHLSFPVSAPSGTPATTIFLRGLAERDKRHYRMDTFLPIGAGGYDWPTDVLRALHIPLEAVHLLASIPVQLGAADPTTAQVPLRVGSVNGPVTEYRFIVSASGTVADVSYRVDVRDGNHWGQAATKRSLGPTSHPARRPFVVAVPAQSAPNAGRFYRVQITATLPDGKYVSCEVVFFHG
jgi:hypothetical protein